MIWSQLKVGSDSSSTLFYLKNNAWPLWTSLFSSVKQDQYDLIYGRDDIIINIHA